MVMQCNPKQRPMDPAMPKLPPEDIPAAVVRDLRDGMGDDLVAVVLYGSRARGEAAVDSDWDFLVVAEGLPDGPIARPAYVRERLTSSEGNRVAVLAKLPREMEGPPIALYLDIAHDGEILYDTQGFGGDHLALLRDYARREGLRRDRTEHGDVWWYPAPEQRHIAGGV